MIPCGKETFNQSSKMPYEAKMVIKLLSIAIHHFVGSTALNRKTINRKVESKKPKILKK